MRSDMRKVVTETPRLGSRWRNDKSRLKVRVIEPDPEDHDDGPRRLSMSMRDKDFSDLIGPLRRYLHKQVGRPWNKVHSELCQHLDRRTVSGNHIWTHVWMEVEKNCYRGIDGNAYTNRRSFGGGPAPVRGLYVDPGTGLLKLAKHADPWWPPRGETDKQRAFVRSLREYLAAIDFNRLASFRVDTENHVVWEKTEVGWFVSWYHHVPERIEQTKWWDGRPREVIRPAHFELIRRKQASKREIWSARELLSKPPF